MTWLLVSTVPSVVNIVPEHPVPVIADDIYYRLGIIEAYWFIVEVVCMLSARH